MCSLSWLCCLHHPLTLCILAVQDFGDDEGARPSKQRSASGKISLFGAGMADVEDSGAKKDRVNLRTHRRVKGVDPSTWSGYAGVEPLDKVIKMSAQDLKKLCGEHGFPTSGNKQDMIRRLADAVYGRISTLSMSSLLAEAEKLGWNEERGIATKEILRQFLLEKNWVPEDLQE